MLTIPTPIYGQIDKGANPNTKSGVETRSRFDGNHAIILAAPAASLVPNVLRCIPLDYTSKAERGGLDDWATQDLLTFCPGLCPGEHTPVSVTSYKPNSTGIGNERYGFPPMVGGIVVSHCHH